MNQSQNSGDIVDWCKRNTLNCPLVVTSDLSVTVPVTGPNAGELSFDASASYRLLTTEWDDYIEREWCLTVSRYDTEGFGAWTGLIEGQLENLLADGRICRSWPF